MKWDGTYVEGGLHPFWVVLLHSVKKVHGMNEGYVIKKMQYTLSHKTYCGNDLINWNEKHDDKEREVTSLVELNQDSGSGLGSGIE